MRKEKQLIEKTDLEWVMSSPAGRRVMWRVLSHCGIYRDIEGQGEVAAKQIGRRQVGLFLLDIISDASEDNLELMMREAREEAKRERLEYERNNRTNTIESYIDGELPAVGDDIGSSI